MENERPQGVSKAAGGLVLLYVSSQGVHGRNPWQMFAISQFVMHENRNCGTLWSHTPLSYKGLKHYVQMKKKKCRILYDWVSKLN